MTAVYDRLRDCAEVHIWHGRAAEAPRPGGTALLSDEEARKVRRLPGAAAVFYAAAHTAVRRVLSEYLGVPPRGVVFARQPCPRCAHPKHGRPRIGWPSTGLDFSLSRCGPHWLLAVGAGHPVGVDLEDDRPLDVDRASGFVMSAAELAHVGAAPDDAARRHAFFRCWTRKEAVVKAIGVGIATDLREVDVQPADDGPVLVPGTDGLGPWLVQDLPRPDGMFAALAREAAGPAGPAVFLRYEELEAGTAGTLQTREVLVR